LLSIILVSSDPRILEIEIYGVGKSDLYQKRLGSMDKRKVLSIGWKIWLDWDVTMYIFTIMMLVTMTYR